MFMYVYSWIIRIILFILFHNIFMYIFLPFLIFINILKYFLPHLIVSREPQTPEPALILILNGIYSLWF